MRFAAIALAIGLVGTLLAANVQGTPTVSVAEAAPLVQPDEAVEIDDIETGSIAVAGSDVLRLIDLRSGTTCKATGAAPAGSAFTGASIGRDCQNSPSLARIAQWRTAENGGLIMADSKGATVLEFAPGDGVLYESVFPADQLITIVPARG